MLPSLIVSTVKLILIFLNFSAIFCIKNVLSLWNRNFYEWGRACPTEVMQATLAFLIERTRQIEAGCRYKKALKIFTQELKVSGKDFRLLLIWLGMMRVILCWIQGRFLKDRRNTFEKHSMSIIVRLGIVICYLCTLLNQ